MNMRMTGRKRMMKKSIKEWCQNTLPFELIRIFESWKSFFGLRWTYVVMVIKGFKVRFWKGLKPSRTILSYLKKTTDLSTLANCSWYEDQKLVLRYSKSINFFICASAYWNIICDYSLLCKVFVDYYCCD